MESLNYKVVLTDLQNSIIKQTLQNDYEIIELLVAHLNTIYGLMSIYGGAVPEIFPVRSADRAQKFMVLVHTISAFQFGSSIMDMLISGQYPEADALTRSLIETVAFAEYYKNNPKIAYDSVNDVKNLPYRSTVFRFLAKSGKWPSNGPENAFKRHNVAAHGNITSVTSHWMKSSGIPQITEIWLRRYNSKSFYEIARDQIIPLLGIQQIFRDVFIENDEITKETPWLKYWIVGHDRKQIMKLFPGDITIPD